MVITAAVAASRHRPRNKPVQEFSENFALDRKIKEAVTGLLPTSQRPLLALFVRGLMVNLLLVPFVFAILSLFPSLI